jgi:hypothetical protein
MPKRMKNTLILGIIAVFLEITVFQYIEHNKSNSAETILKNEPFKKAEGIHERSLSFKMANRNRPGFDEKMILRQDWEETIGFDVWRPYYKYKEIEKSVKGRFSFNVFKLKGEPVFENNQVFYVFKSNF